MPEVRYTKKYRELISRKGYKRVETMLLTLLFDTDSDAVSAALWDCNPLVSYEVSRERGLRNIKLRAKDLAAIGEYLQWWKENQVEQENYKVM